jgi:hypothetical protein
LKYRVRQANFFFYMNIFIASRTLYFSKFLSFNWENRPTSHPANFDTVGNVEALLQVTDQTIADNTSRVEKCGLLGHKSKLSINNKLLIYKAILKPIWTYGIQLWGTTSNSNIEILERFQSKVLRLIVKAPWYVPNSILRKDLRIPSVKEEIIRFSSHYNVRIIVHPNELIASLTEPPIQRRLRRYWPHDLLVRF